MNQLERTLLIRTGFMDEQGRIDRQGVQGAARLEAVVFAGAYLGKYRNPVDLLAVSYYMKELACHDQFSTIHYYVQKISDSLDGNRELDGFYIAATHEEILKEYAVSFSEFLYVLVEEALKTGISAEFYQAMLKGEEQKASTQRKQGMPMQRKQDDSTQRKQEAPMQQAQKDPVADEETLSVSREEDYIPVECVNIPKALFMEKEYGDLSADAKLLYSLLLDRKNTAVLNGWVDRYGMTYVIYPKSEMRKHLSTSRYRVDMALDELEKCGQMVLVTQMDPGRPCHIYVKDITENRG